MPTDNNTDEALGLRFDKAPKGRGPWWFHSPLMTYMLGRHDILAHIRRHGRGGVSRRK